MLFSNCCTRLSQSSRGQRCHGPLLQSSERHGREVRQHKVTLVNDVVRAVVPTAHRPERHLVSRKDLIQPALGIGEPD